jgi:hypothetical protein
VTLNRKRLTIVALVLATLGLIEIGLEYPSADPHGIRYKLWKMGFHTMDTDTATGAMIGDQNREVIIIGKTKKQLRKRFGYLVPAQNASPYLRSCYLSSEWKAKDVAFIRTSPWMVVFDSDRAKDLVLIKGC